MSESIDDYRGMALLEVKPQDGVHTFKVVRHGTSLIESIPSRAMPELAKSLCRERNIIEAIERSKGVILGNCPKCGKLMITHSFTTAKHYCRDCVQPRTDD